MSKVEWSKKRWICGNPVQIEKDIKEAVDEYTVKMRADAFKYAKKNGLPDPVRAKIKVIVEWESKT